MVTGKAYDGDIAIGWNLSMLERDVLKAVFIIYVAIELYVHH